LTVLTCNSSLTSYWFFQLWYCNVDVCAFSFTRNFVVGMRKKIKKLIKLKKLEKITKKPNSEKKSIRIFKKPTVRFWFYKSETEKTEPNPNRKKPSQTGKYKAKPEKNLAKPKNKAKPVWTGFCSKITEPNQNQSVWTGSGSVSFFFKN